MKKQDITQLPIINDDDLIYSYKEQWFTGFAPCFQDGIYSLSCCKGNKKTGGMRHNICQNIRSGKTVWVISIAGSDIRSKDHNGSGIDFSYKDAIYLAKIKNGYSWNEYSKLYPSRWDSIYSFSQEKGEIYRNSNGGKEHMTDAEKATDCALYYSGMNQKEIFDKLAQIIVSDEYYIFDPGCEIPDTLNILRGFSYLKNGEIERVKALKDFLIKNEGKFINASWKDPFKFRTTNGKGGCKR